MFFTKYKCSRAKLLQWVGLASSSYYYRIKGTRKGNKPSKYTFNKLQGWVEEETVIESIKEILSRPFIDFVLYDIDNDGWDEIISIEILKDSSYKINSYKWKGFGFEGYLESKDLQTMPRFHTDSNYLYIEIIEDEYFKLEINKENSGLEWRKSDES